MLEEMRKLIAEQLNCEESEITAETSFKDDLGADSLDLFELVMALEDEYNVEILLENLPYEHIRWIENPQIDLDKINGTSDMKKIRDLKGRPLLLWINSWSIGMTLDRNPGLELSEFGR